MKFILPLSLSFMGLGLSLAHTFIESHIEILTTTHLEQSSIISTLSLLPTFQNIALLATLPALGIYTPALIGIGIMSSNVQAISFDSAGGLSSDPHWRPSSIDKRRAHPRDISAVASGIEHKNSYHVAGVLIKKFGDLIRHLNGQHAEFESSGHLPKFAALDRDNADKGESTNIDPHESSTDSSEQHHVAKPDLKIRRNGNMPQSKGLCGSYFDALNTPDTDECFSDVNSGPLASRSRWQDFIHLCWGLGSHYNPHENRCDAD
ncbi:uncharacterized protein EAF01_005893 [Botrytis porri]|uniref:uncharacterized protein n=1 Tax=Botrytis porri TaxID=87229 RepID=UPI0019011924|nr:uncharacterized protein EAF01_005893 [Botrytis porri]KAF7905372.1 hypothetical protein EAF01_005893 [Botrytis porri]